jgi:hypothetical protein
VPWCIPASLLAPLDSCFYRGLLFWRSRQPAWGSGRCDRPLALVAFAKTVSAFPAAGM